MQDNRILQLPEVQKFAITNPPLVLALCQVQFVNVLGIADPRFVAPFQRELKQIYPILTQNQEVGIEVGIGPDGGKINRKEPSNYYQFSSKDDSWRVILSQASISLETRKYKKFGDFLERLNIVLSALIKHIEPAFGLRIGLRYVDEIRPGHTRWSDIIKPELLGVTSLSKYTENARVLSVQRANFELPDKRGINIQHGIIGGGTTVRPIKGERLSDEDFYALDFDVYQEFESPDFLEMDAPIICDYVTNFHKTIDDLFIWSLNDEYLSEIGVKFLQ